MKALKDSTDKPHGKPPPWDKILGIEPAILFYEIEYGDETEKGEEVEIIVVYDSRLVAYKQNLVKRQFHYIHMFDQEVPVVNNAMRNLTVKMFEHLEIILPKNVEIFLPALSASLED